MKEQLIQWLEISGPWAFIISLAANALISLLAFVPSVFITAANLSFFGFANGLLLSFFGELIGVMISFYVYRRGFSFLKKKKMPNNTMLKTLSKTKGRDAFMLILALRIFPFAPSGAITLAAAYSNVSTGVFFLASLFGKIPAIVIEAAAVHQVLKADWHIQLIMGIGSLLILVIFWIFKRKRNKKLQG